MKDYRPISLVRSLYKILAKVLANRMKKVIGSVVGDFQMAFVRNRQTLDNFIIAEEIIHHWKKSKKGGLLVKLDFEKAYDSLDHNFLDDIMGDMGFGAKWRQWIKCCISTPLLSVLVNGFPTRQFKSGPFSPFLINIAVEGLSTLLKKVERRDMLKGAIFEEGGGQFILVICNLPMIPFYSFNQKWSAL
ncbi:hypothetical protein Ddye_014298 [Dipteronia dyeriana]|uniref:Reverse transcriptase domain-containing protein n=1 Tax=Dipteronia dyeriana TaxID=168575 RepID=A0AAD9X7Y5_9ROSI|nr:hypothetical protein Ddye_014298 [Dipteronia dyeriana]